ncbi:MYND-type zinc finger-containing chromatin reader ZMYND8 isoform X3 [Macrosteles quadrilineatus]|uniref:MYND-type zinc finger-containing chromatin reader ZMYND8 isoform X3 n=1 Tax=Macrosteles quadrilineatus TaxID=74068 RepID=UPI0023E19112|nr:MYND-type zinc finger-containing chromatin reader ZMYND8 isoform X3 [Macrosteles quadrilineatus]
MDTPSKNVENQRVNDDSAVQSQTDQCVNQTSTIQNEEEIKLETTCDSTAAVATSETIEKPPEEPSPELGDFIVGDKMDVKPSVIANDAESTTEPLKTQGTGTPESDIPQTDNKPRTRDGSESSQTPPANKIARLTPRATRSSQNPDFAAKQRKFLDRVHDPIKNNNSDSENSQSSPAVMKGNKENKPRSAERKTPVQSDSKKKPDKESTPKRPADSDDESSPKRKKTKEPTKVVDGVDSYCWKCHRDGIVVRCDCPQCPRVYHVKCVQLDKPPEHPWMCPECSQVNQAEDTDTRSRAMRMLSLEQLCTLLRFALNRMKSYEGAEDFAKPVDLVQFPHYRDYIVRPMDLSQLERNLKARQYGSTEAFLADTKWIVHNSIIFNSVQSKFTNTARALVKLCRQEMQHIENCPDCYLNSHTRSSDSWFTEACRRPHILVWAKLKGFPFWPAKVMSVNTGNANNQVDVRFFGAHDRAWIPLNQCYLYSKLSPTPTTNNKNKRTLEECLKELEYHIKKLRDKFGQFEYAPYKTPYDPNNEDEQLLMMLPQFETKSAGKRIRLSLHQDGARKSLGRRTSFPKNSPSVAEQTPVVNDTGTLAESSDMVAVTKAKGGNVAEKTPSRIAPLKSEKLNSEQTPVSKGNTTPMLKKKTPLTAGAKKCFATDNICVKCNSRTTAVNEASLCSVCAKVDDKPEVHEGKQCSGCGTTITMTWMTNAVGDNVCSSCGYAELYKIDEKIGDPNSTVRGVVTVQRKRLTMGEGDQLEEVTDPLAIPENNVAEKDSSQPEVEQTTETCVAGPGMTETGVTETASETNVETGLNESPPKFVIQKSQNIDPLKPTKKTIVDNLQKKLCFTVVEALKNQLTPEEIAAIEADKEVDSSPEKVTEIPQQEQLTQQTSVVLHDLKNDKEVMDKLRETEAKKDTSKTDESHSIIEGGSEADTDVSSCGDSDIVTDGKKGKKNLNKVVQNLKERKSSVDERSDQSKKAKESNAVMLDDSIEESPVLIIDEGESSDSKKSTKSDKNRRKGIPAKVHSRSSTSTESEDNRPSKRRAEVLDEASGHFRRLSSDKDRPVTITVVTEGDSSQKKAKEIRSVNISKSLSLSVIKDSAAAAVEKSAETDSDDLMIVDTVTKFPLRPTARKTLPNPPRLASVISRPASVPPPVVTQPPPLVSLKQKKPVVIPVPAATPRGTVKPSPRAEVGPAHAKLEEVVQKVVTFVRTTFEEMLKASDPNSDALEAMKQSQQLEIEKLRWQHKQEINELKHNTDLVVMEMRSNMEADKQRSLIDLKHKMEIEKEHAVVETKRKQWCSTCQKEAQLYCCWNTAYCSYDCQQEHWIPHMKECRNKQHDPEERSAAAAAAVSPHRLNFHQVDQCLLQRIRGPHQMMPPPATVPPYRPHMFPGIPQVPPPRPIFHNQRPPQPPPGFYPPRSFCPQCP